jgi:ABC-type lipoprotein export system ATPase subunit
MTLIISGGNQHKAERIAKDLVKDLTVSDVDATVQESMSRGDEQRLCTAIDKDFVKNENRLILLDKKISDAANNDVCKLVDEWDALHLAVSIARQKVCFVLGYEAALRLLGINDRPKGKRSS